MDIVNTLGTLDTLGTLGTLDTLGTLGTSNTLGTLGTLGTLDTLDTLGTLDNSRWRGSQYNLVLLLGALIIMEEAARTWYGYARVTTCCRC